MSTEPTLPMADIVREVARRAMASGLRNVEDGLRQSPKATIVELAARIGVTPERLMLALVGEGAAEGRVRERSKELLCRLIWQHAPHGWGTPPPNLTWEFQAALIGSKWFRHLRLAGVPLSEAELLSSWRTLVSLVPGPGWTPESKDDPLISRVHTEGAWAQISDRPPGATLR